MNGAQYRKLRLVDMQERRWRTTRTLRNGYIELPPGREIEITGKRSGLDVKAAACECCGVRVYIKRVHPGDVEEVVL